MKTRLVKGALVAGVMLALAGSTASARGFSRAFAGPFGGQYSATYSRMPGSAMWTRSYTGPYGNTFSGSYNRSCAGGSCTWSRYATGPQGGTLSRTGSCTAGSPCSRNSTLTTSTGASYSWQRSFYPAYGYYPYRYW